MSSRVLRILAGPGLFAVALVTHVWTRGDVALGLFGGKYGQLGGRCETWSWTTMGVADRMSIASAVLRSSASRR